MAFHFNLLLVRSSARVRNNTRSGRNQYLRTSDVGLRRLTRSQNTTSIHVTGPHKINQVAASLQRVPSYIMWNPTRYKL